jgi:hypothetical protein
MIARSRVGRAGRSGWWALVLLGAAAGAARATDLTASPSLSLSPAMTASGPALKGSWQVVCSTTDAQTTYGWAGLSAYYSVTVGTANEVQIPNGGGLLGTESGSTTSSGDLLVTGGLGGSMVRVKFGGVFCHHDQQNSEFVDVWTQDLVVPPNLTVLSAYNPDRPNDPPSVGTPIAADVVPDVPQGQPLVMLLNLDAHPKGAESLELHYEGAGVQFVQVLHDVQKEYQPALEKVTPTTLGANLSVYAIFQPYASKSNILKFHVVADPNAGTPDGGTGAAPSSGGCGSTAGLDAAALLGAAALLRRRPR